MKYIPYGRQYIDQDDIDAVIDVLRSDLITQGPKVKELEDIVAAYHNCKYAVAFSSGTAALHGAYFVSTKFPFGKSCKTIEELNKFFSFRKPSQREFLEFKNQYWEFITTPITFAASANAGLFCGGSPKLVDIDMATYCIDIEKIEDSITDDTRVITPVSYAGYPVDIKQIKELPRVKQNNICIIHDACHALGAIREGQGIADYADMTILSFHPVKHITTGEGGMVLTNNKDYYEQLLLFRNHGITKDPAKFLSQPDGDWYYEMQELGYNYRISDIQSALGISQMKKIDKFLYKRNEIAHNYELKLYDLKGIILPPGFNKEWIENSYCEGAINERNNLHSYHLFPLRIDTNIIDRKKLFGYLRNNGIGVQVHYMGLNKLPYYGNCLSTENVKNSLMYYDSEISIPMYYGLSEEEIDYTVMLLTKYVKNEIKDKKYVYK